MMTGAPVAELVFTIQFPKIANVSAIDAAAWSDQVRDRFPIIQQVGRLPPIDPRMPTQAQVNSLQLAMGGIELPRMWFISSDSRRVLQFQDDRFGFNWRKINPLDQNEQYPSYATLKKEFAAYFNEFSDWCEGRFKVRPKPTAGDLNYVNVLPLTTDSGARRLSDIFAFFKLTPRKVFGFQTMWMEPITEGASGFIVMNATSGALSTGESVAGVTMISRIDLADVGGDATTWFDGAHDHTLELFKSVIRSEAWSVEK